MAPPRATLRRVPLGGRSDMQRLRHWRPLAAALLVCLAVPGCATGHTTAKSAADVRSTATGGGTGPGGSTATGGGTGPGGSTATRSGTGPGGSTATGSGTGPGGSTATGSGTGPGGSTATGGAGAP